MSAFRESLLTLVSVVSGCALLGGLVGVGMALTAAAGDRTPSEFWWWLGGTGLAVGALGAMLGVLIASGGRQARRWAVPLGGALLGANAIPYLAEGSGALVFGGAVVYHGALGTLLLAAGMFVLAGGEQ